MIGRGRSGRARVFSANKKPAYEGSLKRREIEKTQEFKIHLFDKYLLIAYCVPGTMPGTEDTAVNTVDIRPSSRSL